MLCYLFDLRMMLLFDLFGSYAVQSHHVGWRPHVAQLGTGNHVCHVPKKKAQPYDSSIYYLVGGLKPLKNMKVKWDEDIPNIWETNAPNHQPVMYMCV